MVTYVITSKLSNVDLPDYTQMAIASIEGQCNQIISNVMPSKEKIVFTVPSAFNIDAIVMPEGLQLQEPDFLDELESSIIVHQENQQSGIRRARVIVKQTELNQNWAQDQIDAYESDMKTWLRHQDLSGSGWLRPQRPKEQEDFFSKISNHQLVFAFFPISMVTILIFLLLDFVSGFQ